MNINVDKRWFERQFDERGLSLRGMAKAIGIDPAALSRALNGKRRITVDELAKIATILEVAESEVLAHVMPRPAAPESDDTGMVRAPTGRRHPLFGCLRGMLTIAPGTDLTEPADPDLADHLDRKYGAEVRGSR